MAAGYGWIFFHFALSLQWFEDEMEPVRYFQPPCLSGLVQSSFKGHYSLTTATANPLDSIWITGLEETTSRTP